MSASPPLYLVRHCQATGQEPDAPLTARGEQQSAQLANFLQPSMIAHIVTSPFRRAQQTVEPLALATGLPVEIDARLAERTLSTEPLPDWRERLQATWDDFDMVLPGGESSRADTTRGMATLSDALARMSGPTLTFSPRSASGSAPTFLPGSTAGPTPTFLSGSPPGPTVVVTHGNLLSLLLHAMDGRPGVATWERLTNPDVFQVQHSPGAGDAPARWTVTRLWAP